MKILCLHSNSIEYEAVKKAIKEPEEISSKKGGAKECLVVLISSEKPDESNPKKVAAKLVDHVKKIASDVKVKNVVFYPYVHLTNNPSNPKTALEILDRSEKVLKKDFKVSRSPFGWYKTFCIDVKGHPLAELSRSFGPEQEKEKRGVEQKFFFDGKKLSSQEKMNLTSAVIVGKAISELFPEAVVGSFGLAQDQAYIDIAGLKLNQGHVPRIEKKALEISQKASFKEVKSTKNHYQKEILKDTKGKIYSLDGLEVVPLYKDPFSSVKALKVFSMGSAYWRGSTSNKQLTRVYCAGFENEKNLEKYAAKVEEAERKSHKAIGEKMGLFTVFDKVGKGLPVWLPKGQVIKAEVEKYALEVEEKYGYERVSTPALGKKELFETSGHLPYYEDSMFPGMEMDDGTYYLKAMNCPTHHLIFKNTPRSYRDMPVRIAEYGLCHRNELSGTLSGLQRVRCMTMNDAHIYMRKDQIQSEIENVLKMIAEQYKTFGLKDYWFRLSVSDLESREKYIGQSENWEYAEGELRKCLKKMKVKYVEAKDEAAFYGPKIDIQFRNVFGKEESMSTVQLDFVAKERFGLEYVDKNGKKNSEIFVIHRAPLSTHERFVSFLIEQYEGNFPLWLSPEQVRIVTVTDRGLKFAEEIYKKMKEIGVRVTIDNRNETMGKKVRDAQVDKVNYVVTIGDKEVDSKKLAVRSRNGKLELNVGVGSFIEDLGKKIRKRS